MPSLIVITGTITPDGGLNLDQKIPAPAGPVRVTIEPIQTATQPQKDWWLCMQEGRASLEVRGTGFRTEEEIDAEREAFRAEPASKFT